jgi:hypothetical protein
MPIGEDIPMLIPISILITVIVLFIFGVYTNMTEQNELIRMSQVSIDTVDYIANIKYGDDRGNLNRSKLGANLTTKDWTYLKMNVNYKMNITIYDYTTKATWTWRNFEGDIEKSVVTSVPINIFNGNTTNLGKVTVSVSK